MCSLPFLVNDKIQTHLAVNSFLQEEQFYEIDIPLKFTASVCTRVHGLACWFDVLFDGRYITIYMFASCTLSLIFLFDHQMYTMQT